MHPGHEARETGSVYRPREYRGSKLLTYDWVTKYIVDFSRPSSLNANLRLPCTFLREPNAPTFLPGAYRASRDCRHCEKINQDRPANAERFPCIINLHFGRCLLCLLTRFPDEACCVRLINPEIQCAREDQQWRREHGRYAGHLISERKPLLTAEDEVHHRHHHHSPPTRLSDRLSDRLASVHLSPQSSAPPIAHAHRSALTVRGSVESALAHHESHDRPKACKRAHFLIDDGDPDRPRSSPKARRDEVHPSSPSIKGASQRSRTHIDLLGAEEEGSERSSGAFLATHADMCRDLELIARQREAHEREKRVLRQENRAIKERIAELEAERERAILRGRNRALKERLAELEADGK